MKLQILSERVPENEFSPKKRVSRLSRLNKDEGISPLNSLLLKSNFFRFIRLPTSSGMVPVIELRTPAPIMKKPPNSNAFKFSKFHISEGIIPVN